MEKKLRLVNPVNNIFGILIEIKRLELSFRFITNKIINDMRNFRIFLVSIFIVFTTVASAQIVSEKTLSVQGYGEVNVKPDVANINFNLSSTNTDFNKAIDELNSKINKLSKALRKVGISKEDIHSANYNINKEYKHNYKTGEKTFLGFKVSHTITLQTSADTKSVNKVFDALISSLSEVELNLSFGIKNPENSKEQMLTNAINDAKSKAEIMAKASGVKLAGILSINYNVAPIYPRGGSNYVMLSKRMAVSATPVMVDNFNPSDIKQSTSVSVVWLIE